MSVGNKTALAVSVLALAAGVSVATPVAAQAAGTHAAKVTATSSVKARWYRSRYFTTKEACFAAKFSADNFYPVRPPGADCYFWWQAPGGWFFNYWK